MPRAKSAVLSKEESKAIVATLKAELTAKKQEGLAIGVAEFEANKVMKAATQSLEATKKANVQALVTATKSHAAAYKAFTKTMLVASKQRASHSAALEKLVGKIAAATAAVATASAKPTAKVTTLVPKDAPVVKAA